MKNKITQNITIMLAAASVVYAEPQKADEGQRKRPVLNSTKVKKVDKQAINKAFNDFLKREGLPKTVAGPVWWWDGGADVDADRQAHFFIKSAYLKWKWRRGEKFKICKGLIYNPENTSFATSVMTKDGKASKRLKEKTGHAITFVKNESTEILFSWKQNKKMALRQMCMTKITDTPL